MSCTLEGQEVADVVSGKGEPTIVLLDRIFGEILDGECEESEFNKSTLVCVLLHPSVIPDVAYSFCRSLIMSWKTHDIEARKWVPQGGALRDKVLKATFFDRIDRGECVDESERQWYRGSGPGFLKEQEG